MIIQRDQYLNKLIEYAWDGQIKVITGMRRSGKSYLLNTLYKNYLLENGIEERQIILIELDKISNIMYRNPLELTKMIHDKVRDEQDQYYIFIDEIQMCDEISNPYNKEGTKITFVDALNDIKTIPNVDVYVTGSNSKMLSKDILTTFRGRSDEIQMHPLSFKEFYSAYEGSKEEAFAEYTLYGGLPFVLSRKTSEAKMEYLKNLFDEVYLKDVVERKKVAYADILGQIVDLICSSIGSLTNPNKIYRTIVSKQGSTITQQTVASYIEYLKDSFLFKEAKRYDVKGKSYFDYPYKYYCEDIGLRNARLGYRQQEITHIMENIIYNELIVRGYNVDVGVVYRYRNNRRIQKEIDFIAIKGDKKIYIQSAYALDTPEKKEAELDSLRLTKDTFPKIIIRNDVMKRWYDEEGILNIHILDFLLDDSI